MWNKYGSCQGGPRADRYTLPDNVQQRHVRQPPTILCKTRGCLWSFRLLMMGGVAPETCWASFNIRNNKSLIHCCILLAFSVRNYTIMHGSTIIKLLKVTDTSKNRNTFIFWNKVILRVLEYGPSKSRSTILQSIHFVPHRKQCVLWLERQTHYCGVKKKVILYSTNHVEHIINCAGKI
jgi:hypothetical protein